MKKVFNLIFAIVLLACLPLSVSVNADELAKPYLVDSANLLSNQEFKELSVKLAEISYRQKCDVVIVTANTMNGKTAQAFADDFYDYNGYGQGTTKDGIIFTISMSERKWAISTTGKCINIFTDYGQEQITDKIIPDLKDANYFNAFLTFAEQCDEYISHYNVTGKAYDIGDKPKDLKTYVIYYGGAVLLAFIIAFVIVSNMKAKLKTVRFNNSASNYTRDGSMVITSQNDMYLYSNVTRTEIPKNNGGSSTHTGSSGTTHGGSSGSF